MGLEEINRFHFSTDERGDKVTGNPKEFFGFGLVGFVDLLGFSADVISSWSQGEQSPLARLFRIKDAAGRISDAGIVGSVPGKPLFDPTVHRPRVHTVSDSIVVCCALPSAGTLYDINMAMSVVSQGVQMAWEAALKEGYTIRGAMELGEIYWAESETIGPALVTSYSLESKIANKSRVILGPLFLRNLLQRANTDWSAWPSSEWLSVSYDNLIEISPHHLKRNARVNIEALEELKRRAGKKAEKYNHILDVLRAECFHKASLNELESGIKLVESAIQQCEG
jgi:hypothetical protein